MTDTLDLAPHLAPLRARLTALERAVAELQAGGPAPEPAPGPAPEPAPPPTPPEIVRTMVGPGLAAAVLTQTTLDGSGTKHVNAATEDATSFRAPGRRIDSLRLYHVYTRLDSGYSRGDGGTVEYRIHAHDPATGQRDPRVLARTGPVVGNTRYWTKEDAAKRYPGAIWSQHGETGTALYSARLIDLLSPLETVPGARYWVSVVPANPDAADHHISINHVSARASWVARHLDPRVDDAADFRVTQWRGGEAIDRSDHPTQGFIGILEVVGDESTGFAYYQVPTQSDVGGDTDRTQNVDGRSGIRSVWTPERDCVIESLHVAAARVSGSAPLVATVRQGGAVLGSVQFDAAGFPTVAAGTTAVDLQLAVRWQAVLDLSIAVRGGEPVHVELSTQRGTDYEVTAVSDWQAGPFGAGGSPATHMQYTDDGHTWVDRRHLDMAWAAVVRDSIEGR